MSVDPIAAAVTIKSVVLHVAQWLRNLGKAGAERQRQSLSAVNKVLPALRMTEAYCRGLSKGISNPTTEGEIASRWTEVSVELETLGIAALAKKCDVNGRYWANPDQFAPQFLDEADIRFESVERLARDLKVKIKLGLKTK